ncbi:MAG: hypothetical protein ACKVJ2_14605, partial [Pseudomonadales bacterium]
GDAPGHVDLSFYGFLAGYLYADCPISTNMISKAGLEAWVAKMNSIMPLDTLFVNATTKS